MRPPDEEESDLQRRTRAVNAVVYGAGQLLLAFLVVVAARECAPALSGRGTAARALVLVLCLFAIYAFVRGIRDLRGGIRGFRALRADEGGGRRGGTARGGPPEREQGPGNGHDAEEG